MTKDTIWHPYTQHAIAPESLHVKRAQGAHLYVDDKQGGTRAVLDAIASWWVITHGHCHPHIVQAVQEQAAQCDQVIFAGFTHEPAEKLADKMMEMTDDHLAHVFYSDSGSTAVEVALKMAIGYWEHTNRARRTIIAFDNAYHGDTFGTMSAGARSVYHKLYEPYLFDVIHIPVPVAGQEAKALSALEAVLKEHKDDVAAFIFEPLLQAAGGMQIYSADALGQMAKLCRAHDVLLIADEVMTGFGRTGTFFACDQAEFVPDILCMSKGLTAGFLPMGATLCSADIYRAFYHKDKSKMFFHSSSFMGNALSCAAAYASLEIWQNEDVQGRIDQIVQSHITAQIQLSRRKDLTNIRQIGTMLAMDLVVEDGGGYLSAVQPKLYDFFLAHNVLLRPLGNTIYILPPYCTTPTDLDAIYTVIHDALDALA